MLTTACVEPTLAEGVADVLDRHNAEAAFQAACDVARSCFPAMRSLHVRLTEDPDVDGRIWVVLEVLLPELYSMDLLERERLHFHEEMVRRVPLELNLLFGLSIGFVAE